MASSDRPTLVRPKWTRTEQEAVERLLRAAVFRAEVGLYGMGFSGADARKLVPVLDRAYRKMVVIPSLSAPSTGAKP